MVFLSSSTRRTKRHQNYLFWKLFWIIETKTWIKVFVSITQNNVQKEKKKRQKEQHKKQKKTTKKIIWWKFKKSMQKSIFPQKNSKKFVYYNEELVTNSKFQTQLSRKLQRFRTCRKNKKFSIFHELSGISTKIGQLFPT